MVTSVLGRVPGLPGRLHAHPRKKSRRGRLLAVAAGGTLLAGLAAVCRKRCARRAAPDEPAEAPVELGIPRDESREHEPAHAG